MRKLVFILLGAGSIANATTYQPNTSTFTCPDGEIVDAGKAIEITVGERPGGIGECYWREPEVSFNLNQDRTAITAYTTWKLGGGFMADGCENIKGERMTSVGIIAKMQCKTQQQ
jgi:hypothetical protein